MMNDEAMARRQVALQVKNLTVHYDTPQGKVIAANQVNFDVERGELVGLVGESGCGKTTTAMAVLRLVQPPGRIVSGQAIIREEIDLLRLNQRELREIRWKEISLIPQGAMNSLNPVMRIKDQIADGIERHTGPLPKGQLKDRILELFALVGLPSRVYQMYPHELSGGMKQRVCIAMAISLAPTVIIADEPTSALDVIVQRIVAQTLLDIREQVGVSMVVIGHDMGLMAQVVDRVAVMYAGNMVEIAPVKVGLTAPQHPYTRLLIESIPSIAERKPLKITEGLTHDLRNPPPGCIFQLRCPQVMPRCLEAAPPLRTLQPGHKVACYLFD